jgi:hypothetical protein
MAGSRRSGWAFVMLIAAEPHLHGPQTDEAVPLRDTAPLLASGLMSVHVNAAAALVGAGLFVVAGTAVVDASRLPLLFIPASFLLAAYAAGRLIGRFLSGPEPIRGRPVLTLSVRLGVGVSLISMIAVLAAFAGALWAMGLIILSLTAVGLLQLRGLPRVFGRLRDRGLWPAWAAGIGIGFAWLVAWLWATVPPTFFDELAYHLVIPQRALATGKDEAMPWVFFTLMPHASDLLLAWGLALGSDLGGRAMGFVLWVACTIAAWAVAEGVIPRWSNWTGPAVIAALASSSTLWFLATLPFAETALALAMVTAMAIVMAHQTDHREMSPWLPLGLLLGFAGNVKLAGLFWIPAALAAAIALRWPLRDVAKAVLVAVMAILPWWIRAGLHTGNPIYPMAYDFLGGRFWSPESQARVVGDLPASFATVGIEGLIRLPYDLFMHPGRFGSASDVGPVAVFAVLMMLTGPVLVRLGSPDFGLRRLADAAAIFILVAGAGWMMTSTTTRFFAPAFVFALAVVAGALGSGGRRAVPVAMIVVVVFGVWGAHQFIGQQEAVFSSTAVALGHEDREAYLTRRLEHYPAARFVRDRLPEQARVLFIGETRPYHFARASVAPSAYDHHPLRDWVIESSSVEALTNRLKSEGITHVVLNIPEFARIRNKYGVLAFDGHESAEQDRRLKALPKALRPLFVERGVYVFQVPSTRGS